MAMKATTVRFTDDLWELLEREAAAAGISAAHLVRDATIMRLATLTARRGDPQGEEALAEIVERVNGRRREGSEALKGLASPGRVAAVRATGLLDSPPDEAFDRLTRLAQRVLDVPTAIVSLLDADRHVLKSCVGMPDPWNAARELPLSHSFCQHAVVSEEPLVLPDAREDPRFHDHAAVRDIGAVAYAGIPLVTREGFAIGTLCAVDTRPRLWTRDQIQTLKDLAASAVTEVELARTRA